MESRETANPLRGFWDVAVDCGLLTAEESARLSEESLERGVAPGELLRQRSLLEPVELDIIESLVRPLETIPGYELRRVLGHGGMGVVYEAKQLGFDRSVALKTILVHRLGDHTVASRFTKEAKAIGRLQHPHIITGHDFGAHEGRLYLSMELVSGGDLERAVRDHGPMPERRGWEFIRQAALGLEYAQQAGIIHRDIKPANLLLDRAYVPGSEGQFPNVKIADFGLAFLQEEDTAKTRLTSENAAVGSPQYMAPEQLEGGEVDFRADVYALGATAWHLLLGEPPYTGKNLMQILRAKVAGELPDPRSLRQDLSRGSAGLLRELTALRPEDRPGSYSILLQRIEETVGRIDETGRGSTTTTSIVPRELISEMSTDHDLGKTRIVEAIPADSSEGIPRRKSRSWGNRVGVTLLIAVVMLSIWGTKGYLAGTRLFSRGKVVGAPVVRYEPGRMVQLYDGRTLNPSIWHIAGGSWSVSEDEEGGNVISGNSGMMYVNLAGKTVFGEKPFENYRVTFLVQPRKVHPLKIQFGFGQDDKGPLSFLLSLEKSGIDLHVMRGEGKSTQRTLIEPPPGLHWETFFERGHEVHLEKTESNWEIFLDELKVAHVETKSSETRPMIGLEAGPGATYFSDFEMWELVPKNAAGSAK